MKSKTRHVDGRGRDPQFEAPRMLIFYFKQKLIKVDYIVWDAALFQILNYKC